MADKPKIDKLNRGREISRVGDSVKSISVGFMDMDSTIFWYFENVIKPVIQENGEQVKVPIIYSNPERWAAIQKQGFLRDNKQKVMAPVIAFRRTSFSKDDTMPLDKMNPMDPKLHMTFEKKYSSENRYDKLTALKGITPKRELYSVAVPDYVTLNYDFVVWTNFTDQMNSIIEKINWNEGSYWGEPGKFRFRATIDSFEDASEYEDSTRKIKTSFSLTLRGYLLPDEYPPTAVNTQKFITPKQIIINDNTDMNITQLTSIDESGEKTINVINNMGMAAGGGGSGGSTEPLIINPGTNMLFGAITFTGTTQKTLTISTSPTPIFNALTVTGSAEIGGNLSGSSTTTASFGRIQATTIGGNSPLNIESPNIIGDTTVEGNLRATGDLIAQRYIISSSVSHITRSFSSGSTQFGDTGDDTHQFTGSVHISGSLTVHGQTILDSYYTGSESLIVSGAMRVVDQQVGSAVASSSLFMQNLGTISSRDLAGVIDLGDGFQ